VNITSAIKKNTTFVKKLLSLIVKAGQYFYVSKRNGVNRNEIILSGGGAKISIPNQGSHSILKYCKIKFVL